MNIDKRFRINRCAISKKDAMDFREYVHRVWVKRAARRGKASWVCN